jgi:hypothetical protein
MTTDAPTETQTPAECLQFQHAPVRIRFTWWGTTKALDADHKREIADDFDADLAVISASKKLINRKHPAYKALTAIKRSITAYWKAHTLPFTEKTIRLLRREKLDAFNAFMTQASADLREAADELQAVYAHDPTLGANLGRLHDTRNYPDTVADLFSVSWDVVNVTPPEYLLELNPEFYRRECQRVQAQFTTAVEKAETEFVGQLTKLVDTLTDRLTDNEDGTPKVFKEGCVNNLREFIQRFRDLSIHSNDELDKLVTECDNLTRGVSAAQLRDLPDIRKHVAERLAQVKETMETDMTLAPRRRIKRRPTPKG